jgi:hypothetical protein
MEDRLSTQALRIGTALDDGVPDAERAAALDTLRDISRQWLRTDLPETLMPSDRQCLHWPLAFPEVFASERRSGFDAVVANPPFLGGKRISTANGTSYREYLVLSLAHGLSGSADLIAYFLLRMCNIARSVGTLATNTVSQGDTREVGLDRVVDSGWTIQRAVKSERWPNEASLEIAKLWLWRDAWTSQPVLNGTPALAGITASLERATRVLLSPEPLHANVAKSFIGSYVNGMGFILTPEQATSLLHADPRNADVLFPYLNGADLSPLWG